MKKVTILGTKYSIYTYVEAFEKKKLKSDRLEGTELGLTDTVQKIIFIADWDYTHVVRHEIVHAFLFESGLYEQSRCDESWSSNEQVVDWIALQGPKLYKIWKQLGVEDGIMAA